MVDVWVSHIDGKKDVVFILDKNKHRYNIEVGKFDIDQGLVIDDKKKMVCDVSKAKGEAIKRFIEFMNGMDKVDRKRKKPVFDGKPGCKPKYQGKKCKECGYRMTKLYRHSNRKNEKGWIPVVWYCVDCDKLEDRIR